MRMIDLIEKKKKGHPLTKEEIQWFIDGYIQETIPDYQVSSLLMAIYFQGMSKQEISDLTMIMVQSGETIDLSTLNGIKVDKHSTGGVGDKTSLIVAPIVATLGIPVAKMSGRGLGNTGGTIDKLESIHGFQIEVNREEFLRNVSQTNMSIVGQSGNLVPADKKLYALRDVTGTVDSIPLIASSIMSKKIASGADAIVLDVKVGSGAFMRSMEDAKRLAACMVEIGHSLQRKTVAVISQMEQPLGKEVGNANEVAEVIEILRTGQGSEDLIELSLTLAAHMVVLGGMYTSFEEAFEAVSEVLTSGKAFDTFKRFITTQGGDSSQVEDISLLPQATYHIEVRATKSGYISRIDASSVGRSAMVVGAGRKSKEESVDHAVGVTVEKKVGDYVEAGEVLFVLHANQTDTQQAEQLLHEAVEIVAEKPHVDPVILDCIQ